MTTEDMLEEISDLALKSYKKNSKGSLTAKKLDRHEPVQLEGQTFNCWKEYVVFRMAQFVQGYVPSIKVDVYLDGNNSRLELECSDEEQISLNNKMYTLLKEYKK